MRLFVFFSKVLFFLTPFLYFVKGAFQIPFVNNIKDLLILVLGFFSFFRLALSHKKFDKSLMFLFFIFSLVILMTLLKMEDFLFYLISIRELIVYPFLYISIGLLLYEQKIDFNKLMFYSCFLCVLLMYFFFILYPGLSFGLTGRFKAFFDREHLPSIFSALCVLYSLYYIDNKWFKVVVVILSLIIMALTGSRSVLLSLVFVYLIYYIKFSLKNIFSLMFLSFIFILIMQNLFTRDIYYNLEGRTHQYDLARLSIEENFFTGIGIDKYGVLGNIIKEYNYRGYSTVTMDSSFIKYFVNLGVPMALLYLLIFFISIFKKRFKDKEKNVLIMRVLIFAFLMGTVTGKFGAYPLNLIFFMNLMLPKFNFLEKKQLVIDNK